MLLFAPLTVTSVELVTSFFGLISGTGTGLTGLGEWGNVELEMQPSREEVDVPEPGNVRVLDLVEEDVSPGANELSDGLVILDDVLMEARLIVLEESLDMTFISIEFFATIGKNEADCSLCGMPSSAPRILANNGLRGYWFSESGCLECFCEKVGCRPSDIRLMVGRDKCKYFRELGVLISKDQLPQFLRPDGVTPALFNTIDGGIQVDFVVLNGSDDLAVFW